MKNLLLLLSIGLLLNLACSDQTETSHSRAAQDAIAAHRIILDDKEFDFYDQMLYLILALNIYRTHVGNYPSTESNLDALISEPRILEGTGTWNGPYADTEALFLDPWNRRISYSRNEKGVMDLRSLGPDGVPSQDDYPAKDMFPDVFREMEKLGEAGAIPISPQPTPTP